MDLLLILWEKEFQILLDLIGSAVMMLENLGELKAAQKLMSAIEKLTSDKKYLPKDLGGKSTTKQITKAMIDIISGKNS